MSEVDNYLELRVSLELPDAVHLHGVRIDDVSSGISKRIVVPSEILLASKKRRSEFIAGRHCAQRALECAGYGSVADLAINENRLPSWPIDWLGSISHSGSRAVAVACRRSMCAVLSIDTECWIDEEIAREVEGVLAHSEEMKLLCGMPHNQAVTLLFSGKEALFKALYPQVQKFFDFSAARLISVTSNRLNFVLCEDWSESWNKETLLSISYVFNDERIYSALWCPAVP